MKHRRLAGPLTCGISEALLPGSTASVVTNYFLNGNAIRDEPKLQIFRELRDAL